jgi:hypothetical protein
MGGGPPAMMQVTMNNDPQQIQIQSQQLHPRPSFDDITAAMSSQASSFAVPQFGE